MLKHLNAAPVFPARVVVIGAGGFIGGALIKRLAQGGVPVAALTRREVDLLTPEAAKTLAATLRPDDVVVAAAAQAPCKNARMLANNLVMAAAIVEALAISPVAHVVNVSSDAVYADSPNPLAENSLTAPDTLHGVMHLARELAFRSEVKTPLAIVRPTLLYGAADPHNGYGPNRFRRLANAGNDIVLFGKGEERRDHVFIDDLADLIARIIARRSIGLLNIATGNVHSFRDIADLVVAQSPRKVAIKETPRSGPMPHNGVRPFDVGACRSAFPDFNYTPIAAGAAEAQAQEFGTGNGGV
ncbi:MAG TPA: SDR family oxidoreductase [Xanthobacteraceae bacterium]|nr:SDR family oxidoreductase [Xanthobacteraceae bacterium]